MSWIVCVVIFIIILIFISRLIRSKKANEERTLHNIEIKEEKFIENKPNELIQSITQDDTQNESEIIWTPELKRIKKIMFLAPKKQKRVALETSDKPHNSKRESLSLAEQYELAKHFAQLIVEADDLRDQDLLVEERVFCINAIKWCAKNGLSLIYWQTRLNQVNKLLGLKKITLIDKIPSNNSTSTKYLSAADKNLIVRDIKERFEKEYNYHHKKQNHKEEQAVVLKAIKWAEDTGQLYYKDMWVQRKRTSKKTKPHHTPSPSRPRRRRENEIPTEKKRRPRIVISSSEKHKTS